MFNMSELNVTFEPFDVNDADGIHLRWTKWISRFNRYLSHSKTTAPKEMINARLMVAGYDVEQIYNEKTPNGEDYAAVTKALEEHFNPKTSQFLNRYNFRFIAQHEGESFDEFVSKIKEAAKLCNFTGDDEVITQIISLCRSDALKKKALAKVELTLVELITMGRSDDIVKIQVAGFKAKGEAEVFNMSQNRPQDRPKYSRSPPPPQNFHNYNRERHNNFNGFNN